MKIERKNNRRLSFGKYELVYTILYIILGNFFTGVVWIVLAVIWAILALGQGKLNLLLLLILFCLIPILISLLWTRSYFNFLKKKGLTPKSVFRLSVIVFIFSLTFFLLIETPDFIRQLFNPSLYK